jgi:hypothetical protein
MQKILLENSGHASLGPTSAIPDPRPSGQDVPVQFQAFLYPSRLSTGPQWQMLSHVSSELLVSASSRFGSSTVVLFLFANR